MMCHEKIMLSHDRLKHWLKDRRFLIATCNHDLGRNAPKHFEPYGVNCTVVHSCEAALDLVSDSLRGVNPTTCTSSYTHRRDRNYDLLMTHVALPMTEDEYENKSVNETGGLTLVKESRDRLDGHIPVIFFVQKGDAAKPSVEDAREVKNAKSLILPVTAKRLIDTAVECLINRLIG